MALRTPSSSPSVGHALASWATIALALAVALVPPDLLAAPVPAPAEAVAALPAAPVIRPAPVALRASGPQADDAVAGAERAMPAIARRLKVPVLMYHYVSEVPAAEAGSPGARDLRVPPTFFAQHLEFLRGAGYHTVTAPQLWAALNSRAELPDHPILLTFDDGYADAYQSVMPLLLQYGFTGTFFITVNLVGRPGYVTWDQVRAMSAAGMDIESHAMDHVSMAKRAAASLRSQLADSRRILSERTGTDVRFFAYPAGEYGDEAIAAAAAAGYDGAFLDSGGGLQSPEWAFMLRRSRIAGYTGAAGLRALLGGA